MESLLINLLILGIVAAVGWFIITKLVPAGMPQNIALCVLLVIIVIWLIRMIGGSGALASLEGPLYASIMLA